MDIRAKFKVYGGGSGGANKHSVTNVDWAIRKKKLCRGQNARHDDVT